jgi:glycerol-3-phosphate acyltransferase PlsY
VVLVTPYVSAGSLTVVTLFFLLWVILGQTGNLGLLPEYLTESYLVVFLWAALAFWRHRANLVRLIHGTENKFGSKKKE